MKTISMSGSLRENVGKKGSKALRNQGQIPCVIYGGKEQIQFYTAEENFKELVYSPEVAFAEISVNGKTYRTILQDIQYHPVSDKIIHADFYELIEGRTIVMNIPIKVVGNSIGLLKGGKLSRSMRKLKVRALPGDMPETITIDITDLDILQYVKVADVENEKYQLLDPKGATILLIKSTRNAVAETPKK
jgi:large subunit ribosomal protein L25